MADDNYFNYETDRDRDPTGIPEGNLRVLSATLLSVLIAVSFIGNLLLLVTVSSSGTLRQLKFNIFLANLALINLLDTTFNMFLSLVYISEGSWQGFPVLFCPLNAFLINLLAVETLAGLALLTADRAIALQDLKRYSTRMSATVTMVAIATVWLLGLLFCAPIAVKSIISEVFPGRYFCAVAPGSPLGYSLVMLFVFATILVALFVSFGLVFWRAHQDRLGVRPSAISRASVSDDRTLVIIEHRNFQAHLSMGWLALLLFLAYFVLQAPYGFLNYIAQIRNSEEMAGTPAEIYRIPPGAETSITWLKFIYPPLFPFLVCLLSGDVWVKLKALICCRRTSVVTTSADRHVPLNELRPISDAGVLTLVGTSGGLQVKTTEYGTDGETVGQEYAYADVVTK